jgi:DNA-binding CsgD family transcriptional regulator
MQTEVPGRSLVRAIHEAALDPARWQGVAIKIDQVLGSGGVAIHLLDEASRSAYPIGAVGFDPGFLDSYLAHYGAISPWPEKFLTMPRAWPRHSFMDLPEDEYMRTEFYQDWMRPQEDRVASVGIRTAGPGPRSLIPTVNLRRRDLDRLEQPALQLLDALHLHLAHASTVNDAIARLSAQAIIRPLEGEIAQMGGVVIVSDERILLWADAGAVGLLGPVLRMTQLGRLGFVDPEAQNWFEATIAALRHRSKIAAHLACQFRESGAVWTVRSARCDTVTPHLPHIYSDSQSGHRAIALVIERSDMQPRPADRLRQTFGLTLAEAEVALSLVEGRTTDEIADLRRTSRNTIRNQIQSVLSKMDARTRGDIIRTLSRLLDKGRD